MREKISEILEICDSDIYEGNHMEIANNVGYGLDKLEESIAEVARLSQESHEDIYEISQSILEDLRNG